MRKFITALALISLLTIPAIETANAAPVSPARRPPSNFTRPSMNQTYLAVVPAIGLAQV
jgi:hypothetical protein